MILIGDEKIRDCKLFCVNAKFLFLINFRQLHNSNIFKAAGRLTTISSSARLLNN
jgi:hypothetical protein